MSQHDKTTLDAELLHRYHDGELAAEERAGVEARLDDDARARLAALDDLGAAVRHTVAARASEGPDGSILHFDAWSAIEREIESKKVVSLSDRIRRRRVPIWISSVAAAAAAMLVVFGPWGTSAGLANGCEIESVEAEGANVAVIKMPGDQMTVVWVSHED